MWNTNVFYFSAERLSIGESGIGYSNRLTHNAQNLPNVLHTLQNENGDVFDKLVRHLREIFPTVGNLSVRTRPENNNLEIRIWPTEARQTVELSFPLNSSGTGVSQVIALLAAIITNSNNIIIIDEINIFLHPSAVKSLLRILITEYSNNQYIISTHAPEVISFCKLGTVHLVKRHNYESTVKNINLSKISELRAAAEHLGVSMADVFAAERVIWVEGPTEELIFPYIYQEITRKQIPPGIIFTSVTTGDFLRKRDRELVYEIYEKISHTTATLLVAVRFSFDSELLTESEKTDMIRESGGKLNFLPRRHIECYCIDAESIFEFICQKAPSLAKKISQSDVTSKLEHFAGHEKYKIPEWTNDLANPAWRARVDAAKLIRATTDEVSDGLVTFNKKEDTLSLISNIISKRPDSLSELVKYIESIVDDVIK